MLSSQQADIPMIYYIDKVLFKDGQESNVTTHIGETVLRLESLKRSMRKKIQVYDRYHVPIGIIEKRVFKSGLHYDISYDDRIIASFNKSWSFFSRRYNLQTMGGPKFRVKGDFKNFNYKITNGRSVVAKITPGEELNSERYVIETKTREYRYVILCTAAIVSMLK